jgi:putative oxidoreductase
MFEQASAGEPRNRISDWALRGAIGLVFIYIGWDKFDTHSMWPEFFQEVGFGQWFRYFTGIVEALAGVLVLIPWTETIGLAVLAATMAGAGLTWIFRTHQPGNCIVPFVFALGLGACCYSRRSRL